MNKWPYCRSTDTSRLPGRGDFGLHAPLYFEEEITWGGGFFSLPVISFVLTWVPSPQPCPLDFQHRALWRSCPLALPAWAWSCSDSAASLPQGRWCHRNDPWCSGLQEGHQGRLASHVCRQESGDCDVQHLFHEASMTFHSKDHAETINIWEYWNL